MISCSATSPAGSPEREMKGIYPWIGSCERLSVEKSRAMIANCKRRGAVRRAIRGWDERRTHGTLFVGLTNVSDCLFPIERALDGLLPTGVQGVAAFRLSAGLEL